MQNSRLLELFTALSKTEQRELGKFVRSPVFNQRADVEQLYDYLYANYPFHNQQVIRRETVFGALFPGEAFDAAKMDYTMSFLFTAIKNYLVFKEQEADTTNEHIQLVKALRKRNLGRLFEKEYNVAAKMLGNQPFRDADFHFHNYRLHHERLSFDKQESRNLTAVFQDFSNELTAFFVAKKLWQACSAVLHKTVWQADMLEEDILEAILRHVERKDYSRTPAVNLYYHCYKALTADDSLPWFESLRELIRMNYTHFPAHEVVDLYLVAINYCIRRFNNGERVFLEQAFKLYREGLELGAFLENNLLSRFTYNNVVMAGLLLKEFDWVERFLHEYKGFIETKHRESTFHYNLAIFYYQKPDYDKAMELLQKADFDDLMHNLSARRMLLKIYFEKDEREALNSLIISFKIFIYRHKELGGNHRDSYLNLIKFVRRLLSLDRYDKAAVAALKRELEATEPVAEKVWLLSQV
jgi:hypothetical protein